MDGKISLNEKRCVNFFEKLILKVRDTKVTPY